MTTEEKHPASSTETDDSAVDDSAVDDSAVDDATAVGDDQVTPADNDQQAAAERATAQSDDLVADDLVADTQADPLTSAAPPAPPATTVGDDQVTPADNDQQAAAESVTAQSDDLVADTQADPLTSAAPPAPPAPIAATPPNATAESNAANSPAEPGVGDEAVDGPKDAGVNEGADAETVPASATSRDPAEKIGARIREKLTARPDQLPVGTSDGGTPRPEATSGGPAVEIPKDDELDALLEAQISAAMSTDASSPVETAPVAGLESESDAEAPLAEEIGPGSQLSGTVQQIHGDDVFIDAGVRSGVVVALRQFAEDKQPNVGDQLTVIIDSIDNDGLFRARIPQARHKAGGNWDALAEGQVVDCMVTGTNKGGLQVSVSNLRGFMPASQVDLGYVASLESFVGQKLSAQITEVNKKKRNLVLSRRILLQAERESQQGDFWQSLEVGQDYEGIVKTIKDYGAFVSLGPMDGFLHIGEMAWSRINHPKEVVSEGQTVQVKILKLDAERKRISLGMKQLIQNPWQSAVERYAPERIVPGKVTRTADFGAFVELEPGIEGLVHISELAWRRVGSVNEVLSVGETRDFQVIEVDPRRKRISLSVKALEKRPEAPAQEERQSTAAPRTTNPNLRGGTGGGKGAGGLFGNPSDFT